MRVYNRIATVLKGGEVVTVDQFKTLFAGTKVEPVLYRLSTYIYNIKKNGGVVKSVKDGRKVLGYQLLNGNEFDAKGFWVGKLEQKEAA